MYSTCVSDKTQNAPNDCLFIHYIVKIEQINRESHGSQDRKVSRVNSGHANVCIPCMESQLIDLNVHYAQR